MAWRKTSILKIQTYNANHAITPSTETARTKCIVSTRSKWSFLANKPNQTAWWIPLHTTSFTKKTLYKPAYLSQPSFSCSWIQLEPDGAKKMQRCHARCQWSQLLLSLLWEKVGQQRLFCNSFKSKAFCISISTQQEQLESRHWQSQKNTVEHVERKAKITRIFV